MSKLGMLVSYALCTGCGKCADACKNRNPIEEVSGLKISTSGPFQFKSGKMETYYIVTPTDFCDGCAGVTRVCEESCTDHCIKFDDIDVLAQQMHEKKKALFTIPCGTSLSG